MPKINVLSFEVANLIAAGEVVDRPSSVIKELLENSIDAGATKISAQIAHGGITLIKVTDNGCGISSDDLPLAIKRHATSKISSKYDLESITTLGFRGEALAAISSVSEMHIITKTKEAAMGTILGAKGGNIYEISEVGCQDGTVMIIENLFSNVPARRKFLKKDSTEALSCYSVCAKVALSHPEISFEFISDNVRKFKTAGDGNLKNVLYAIEGADYAHKLIEVNGKDSGITVFGYIGRSDNVCGNRNDENFFINGRYVKSRTVGTAVERAFSSYIAPSRFPVCTLLISLDPLFVDVNIHPSKLEVKFSNEQKIFESVYYLVKNALDSAEYRPEINLEKTKKNPTNTFIPIDTPKVDINKIQYTFNKNINNNSKQINNCDDLKSIKSPNELLSIMSGKYTLPHVNNERNYEFTDKKNTYIDDLSNSNLDKNNFSPIKVVEGLSVFNDSYKEEKEKLVIDDKPIYETPNYKYIGELFDTYLIVQTDNKILLIDKHAAHERINFEKMKKQIKENGKVFSQMTLLPIRVNLGDLALNTAEEHREEIEKVGFSFVVCDSKYAEIDAVPEGLSPDNARDAFSDIVNNLKNNAMVPQITESDRIEHTLYQIACKASIKGGRVYDEVHIRWIIEEILKIPNITVCPHGRPVAMELSKNELDRKFERIN